MECLNCKALIPDGQKFCEGDKCKQDFINNVLLLYQPEIMSDSETIAHAQSRVGLTRLLQNMSTDEQLRRYELFLYIAVELKSLLFTTLVGAASRRAAESELAAKLKIKHEVSERDTKLVAHTYEEREALNRKAELKRQGEKLARDGKCKYCGIASDKLFHTKQCKEKYDLLQGFIRVGMPEDVARQQVEAMKSEVFTNAVN